MRFMLSVAIKPILLSVIMLTVVLLNVTAPHNDITLCDKCRFYVLLSRVSLVECHGAIEKSHQFGY